MQTPPPTIAASKYLPRAIAGGLVGVGVGVSLCAGLGGAMPAMLAVGAVVLAAAALGLAPAVVPGLNRSDRFGLAVLAMTLAQTLLAIGAGVLLVQVLELPRRPVVLGVMGGVFIVTLLQAIAGVILLNAIPHVKKAGTDNVVP